MVTQQLLGVAAVAAWLAAVLLTALAVRRRWPQQKEWSRKVVHIGTGAGVLVMACGDGLAGLVGPQINSPRWRLFGQTKSLAGTAAMALTSWLVLALLIGVAQATGTSAPNLVAAAVIAFAATGLEQLSGFGLDNLSVPLATACLWQLAMP